MKQLLMYSSVIFILFSCQQRNFEDNVSKQVQNNFEKVVKDHNQAIFSWEDKIEKLYNISDENLALGVKYADSLIKNDESLDKWKVSNLITIVGEIYYEYDSTALAYRCFQKSESLTFDSPRNKANKAGCLIRFGEFDQAMELLLQASEINHDFKWYVGNLYEILRQTEKAIEEYDYVYQRNKEVYAYYKVRIEEIKNNPENLKNELEFKDRRKRTVITLKSSNKKGQIGGFDVKKNQY